MKLKGQKSFLWKISNIDPLIFREKRDEIRVVKKKVKVSSKLTDSDHELPREGRHLG